MDGFALKHATTEQGRDRFRIAGESLAGHPYDGTLADDECIRITTGAMVPACVDTVIPLENCTEAEAIVQIHEISDQGANIRSAGNDIHQGDRIQPAGHQLSHFDIAWLTACGMTEIEVIERPRVAVFSTGDELCEAGMPLRPGSIYDSNREVLKQLLNATPALVSDLGIIPDNRDAIASTLSSAATDHDLILTSGGVSVGSADYLKEVVAKLGTLDLWRLNLKPGKPLACGTIGKAVFLGLPGNPVSTIVTYLLIAQQALLTMAGVEPLNEPVRFAAVLLTDLKHTPGREEYQRGSLILDSGSMRVSVTGEQSSNRLASFSNADCLIRVPKDSADLSAGDIVDVFPLRGLLA